MLASVTIRALGNAFLKSPPRRLLVNDTIATFRVRNILSLHSLPRLALDIHRSALEIPQSPSGIGIQASNPLFFLYPPRNVSYTSPPGVSEVIGFSAISWILSQTFLRLATPRAARFQDSKTLSNRWATSSGYREILLRRDERRPRVVRVELGPRVTGVMEGQPTWQGYPASRGYPYPKLWVARRLIGGGCWIGRFDRRDSRADESR